MDAGLRTAAARIDTLQKAGLSKGAVKLDGMLVSDQVDWRLAGGWCVQGPWATPFYSLPTPRVGGGTVPTSQTLPAAPKNFTRLAVCTVAGQGQLRPAGIYADVTP